MDSGAGQAAGATHTPQSFAAKLNETELKQFSTKNPTHAQLGDLIGGLPYNYPTIKDFMVAARPFIVARLATSGGGGGSAAGSGGMGMGVSSGTATGSVGMGSSIVSSSSGGMDGSEEQISLPGPSTPAEDAAADAEAGAVAAATAAAAISGRELPLESTTIAVTVAQAATIQRVEAPGDTGAAAGGAQAQIVALGEQIPQITGVPGTSPTTTTPTTIFLSGLKKKSIKLLQKVWFYSEILYEHVRKSIKTPQTFVDSVLSGKITAKNVRQFYKPPKGILEITGLTFAEILREDFLSSSSAKNGSYPFQSTIWQYAVKDYQSSIAALGAEIDLIKAYQALGVASGMLTKKQLTGNAAIDTHMSNYKAACYRFARAMFLWTVLYRNKYVHVTNLIKYLLNTEQPTTSGSSLSRGFSITSAPTRIPLISMPSIMGREVILIPKIWLLSIITIFEEIVGRTADEADYLGADFPLVTQLVGEHGALRIHGATIPTINNPAIVDALIARIYNDNGRASPIIPTALVEPVATRPFSAVPQPTGFSGGMGTIPGVTSAQARYLEGVAAGTRVPAFGGHLGTLGGRIGPQVPPSGVFSEIKGMLPTQQRVPQTPGLNLGSIGEEESYVGPGSYSTYMPGPVTTAQPPRSAPLGGGGGGAQSAGAPHPNPFSVMAAAAKRTNWSTAGSTSTKNNMSDDDEGMSRAAAAGAALPPGVRGPMNIYMRRGGYRRRTHKRKHRVTHKHKLKPRRRQSTVHRRRKTRRS